MPAPSDPEKKTGILLINLGTPDAPTAPAVRRYLREFLSDPLVVRIPRVIWWFILNLFVLTTRPAKVALKYQSVWMKEGSPLRVYTERQAQLMRGFLGEKFGNSITVDHAMRYGTPTIQAGIEALQAKGCGQILALPLYPQYASSTTGSVEVEIKRCLANIRNAPKLHVVPDFHDHPAYVDAIVKNLLAHWMKIGRPDFKRDKLVMTFHGLPRAHIDQGDPYEDQCLRTAKLIADQLNLGKDDCLVTFQSRFGKAEWLQPYTDKTLEALGKQGIRRVDVICPGFAADCLETLEEIAMEGKETFLHAGGKTFNYLQVTNDSEAFIHALVRVAEDNLRDGKCVR